MRGQPGGYTGFGEHVLSLEWGAMAVIDKLRALQIKANLMSDRTVGLMEIEADVRGSVVVLTGEVETEEQRRVAEELAHQVDGVAEVHNEIKLAVPGLDPAAPKVSPGLSTAAGMRFLRQFADAEIESAVRRKLAGQKDVDVSRVDFTSLKEIVHLSGVVRSRKELRRLQDIVLDVRGVTGICSEVVARG